MLSGIRSRCGSRAYSKIHMIGFTVAEMATVLLVIGIVAGGIFAAANNLSTKSGTYRVSQQVLQVAQNMREAYIGTAFPPGWPANGTLDYTFLADGRNIIPAEMRVNQRLPLGDATQRFAHAMGSANTFQILALRNGNATNLSVPAVCAGIPCFRVVLMGLTTDACSNIVRSIPLEDVNYSILQAGTISQTCNGLDVCKLVATPTPRASIGLCDAAGNANAIVWDFKLH